MPTFLYETLNEYLPEISESINEDSISLDKLVGFYIKKANENSIHCSSEEVKQFLFGFFCSIASLSAIDNRAFYNKNPKIKPISEYAYFFILSFARIVDKRITLPFEWHQETGQTILQGNDFLFEIEKSRIKTDNLPIRNVIVVATAIKAKSSEGDVYLLQKSKSKKWRAWNGIGGRFLYKDKKEFNNMQGNEIRKWLYDNNFTPDKESLENAMRREIGEEITLQPDNYQLEFLYHYNEREISKRYGTYANYHYFIYNLILKKGNLTLGLDDIFLLKNDVLKNKYEGLFISKIYKKLDEFLDNGLEDLTPGIKHYYFRAPQLRFLIPKQDNEGNSFHKSKYIQFEKYLKQIGVDNWTKRKKPDIGYWKGIKELMYEYYWEYDFEPSKVMKEIKEYIKSNFNQTEVYIRVYKDSWK